MNKLKILKLSDSVALFLKNPVTERDQQFEGVSGLNFSISPSELNKNFYLSSGINLRDQKNRRTNVYLPHTTRKKHSEEGIILLFIVSKYCLPLQHHLQSLHQARPLHL